MNTEAAIHERFGRYLRERLRIVNDGEIPPVAVVTARFNHLDAWQRPVSAESVRRWMRGISLPELSRLPALCRMLQCTPGDIIDALGISQILDAPDPPVPAPGQKTVADKACNALRSQINEIMRGMDESRLTAMVALFERRTAPRLEAGAKRRAADKAAAAPEGSGTKRGRRGGPDA
jgi:hypothetical protein